MICLASCSNRFSEVLSISPVNYLPVRFTHTVRLQRCPCRRRDVTPMSCEATFMLYLHFRILYWPQRLSGTRHRQTAERQAQDSLAIDACRSTASPIAESEHFRRCRAQFLTIGSMTSNLAVILGGRRECSNSASSFLDQWTRKRLSFSSDQRLSTSSFSFGLEHTSIAERAHRVATLLPEPPALRV